MSAGVQLGSECERPAWDWANVVLQVGRESEGGGKKVVTCSTEHTAPSWKHMRPGQVVGTAAMADRTGQGVTAGSHLVIVIYKRMELYRKSTGPRIRTLTFTL